MLQTVRQNLVKSQNKMRQLANKKRSDRVLKEGNSVYLELQPYKQRSMLQHYHKLATKYYGQFIVIKRIMEVVYKLDLPFLCIIHSVFHVSLLKRSVGNQVVHKNLPNSLKKSLLQPQVIMDRRMVKRAQQVAAQVHCCLLRRLHGSSWTKQNLDF